MSPPGCVIGTAGHIDHGKTSLVKALTGVDCDRFEEEKLRGVTIDIGFAPLTFDNGIVAGMVDVPGHRKFIHNMLAGATGIDSAMLVIAADDSVMPQTVEHLAILELLQVKKIVVSLTKTDLVDEETREIAKEEIRELIDSSPFAGARIIETSVVTGEGIGELRNELADMALNNSTKHSGSYFRMPIDRVFSIKGHGRVVTGTIFSGEVSVDDKVSLVPGGGLGRVRNAQVHGQNCKTATVGARTAINLAGIDKRGVKRGMVVCHNSIAFESAHFVADLLCHRLSAFPISHARSYLLAVHTAHCSATLLLDIPDRLLPGERCIATVKLEEPIHLLHGDRFVLRDSSATYTLGGGSVLAPGGPILGRRGLKRDSAKWITLRERDTGIRGLISQKPWGAPLDGIIALFNIGETELNALFKTEGDTGLFEWKGKKFAYLKLFADQMMDRLVKTVETFHQENGDLLGITEPELAAKTLPGVDRELAAFWIRRLAEEKRIEHKGATIRIPGFHVSFTGGSETVKNLILRRFQNSGFSPPRCNSLHSELKLDRKETARIITVLIQIGELVSLSPEYTLHKSVLEQAREKLRVDIAGNGSITTARFRDLLEGGSRRSAIEILEYFDRTGFTRRVDNKGTRMSGK